MSRFMAFSRAITPLDFEGGLVIVVLAILLDRKFALKNRLMHSRAGALPLLQMF